MNLQKFMPSSRGMVVAMGGAGIGLLALCLLMVQVWTSGSFDDKLAAQNATVGNQVPRGWLDTFNTQGYVSGWAMDPDVPAQSIKVNIYLDGTTGTGTKILSFVASSSRPDVNKAIGYAGNYGFRVQLPTSVTDGQHSIYAYAVDPATGTETSLSGNPRSNTISRESKIPTPDSCPIITPPYCPNGTLVSNGTDSNGCSRGYACKENTPTPVNAKAPIGWLDSFSSRGILSGWTLDPDTPNQSIKVNVYIDGPSGQSTKVGTYTASTTRSDVNRVTGYAGNHGFRITLPNNVTDGAHTAYVYALDSGDGSEKSLSGSPKSANVARSITTADCSFNGQTVAHGSSVTAYKTNSVAQGQTCQSETRTCTNGTLSGSFAHSSCSVETPGSDKIILMATTTNQVGTFVKTLVSVPLDEKVVYTGMKGSVSSYNTKNTFGQMLYTVFWKPIGQCPANGEQYTTYSQISSKYPGLRTLAKVILKNSGSGTATYPINFTLPRGIEINNCVFAIMDGSLLSGGSYTMYSDLELVHKKNAPAPRPTVTTLALGDEVCFGMTRPDSCGGWRTSDTTASYIRYSKKFTSNTELLSIQGSFADAAMSADLMGLLGGQTVSGAWTAKNDYYILPSCPNPSTTTSLSAGPGDYYASLPGDAVNIYSSTLNGNGLETLKQVISKNFRGTIIPKDGCLAHIVKVAGNGAVDAESQFVAFLSATTTAPRPTTTTGYDIIVVAGQSNAVGAGDGPITDTAANETVDSKIFQLGRRGSSNLKVISPFWTSGGVKYDGLQYPGHNTNRPIMGLAIPFARRYVASELAEGRKVLIVPAARGATSISDWVGGGNFNPTLYADMKTRVQAALNLPGDNKIVAVLWHQGESDVLLNTDTQTFTQKLTLFITKMRQDFPSDPKYPMLAGMMVPAWAPTSPDKVRIENAIRSVFDSSNNPKTGVVESNGLSAASTQLIHFSSPALVEFGDRYYQKWKSVKNSTTASEAIGNLLSSLSNLGSKMIGAVWQAVTWPF